MFAFTVKTDLSKKMDLFLKRVLPGKKYKKCFLTKEGSNRHYTRIKTDGFSWILVQSPLEQQRCFLQKLKDLSLMGLNVPKLKAQDDQKGLLLLEDLGDQSLEKEVETEKHFPFVYYFQALNQIIALQKAKTVGNVWPKCSLATATVLQKAKTAGNAWPKRSLATATALQKAKTAGNVWPKRSLATATALQKAKTAGNVWPSFTMENFFGEMLWTEKYLINHFFKMNLKNSFRQNYIKEWTSICEKLTSFPYLPAHRDYHSRNIFIKNKNIYMIDFQDAGFFPRFYDVVSLIYDMYVSSRMDSQDRKKLMDYFLKKAFSNQEVTEEVKQEMDITTLQRLFKACGSFAGFYCLKRQSTHLKYITPALKLIEQLLWEKKNQYPFFLELIKKLLSSP